MFRVFASIAFATFAQVGAVEPSTERWNFAKTVKYSAKWLETPDSVDELQRVVREAPGRVRVVGSGREQTDIADTDGTHVSLEKFKEILVDI